MHTVWERLFCSERCSNKFSSSRQIVVGRLYPEPEPDMSIGFSTKWKHDQHHPSHGDDWWESYDNIGVALFLSLHEKLVNYLISRDFDDQYSQLPLPSCVLGLIGQKDFQYWSGELWRFDNNVIIIIWRRRSSKINLLKHDNGIMVKSRHRQTGSSIEPT